MRAGLRASRRLMSAAAASAVMKNGMGKWFCAVMRDATKPGQITVTPMPLPAATTRRASP